MKNSFLLYFLLLSTVVFSQKITLKVYGSDTNAPLEKAHVFFKNKTTYTNEKGEFTFNLKKKNRIVFSISHLKYKTKEIVYKKGSALKIIYLEEQKEVLDEIKIISKNNLKLNLAYKKLQKLPIAVYAFGSVLNKDKIYVFGGDASSKHEKNKEGLSQVQFSNEREIMQFLNKPKPISFDNFMGSIQSYNLKTKTWNHQTEKNYKKSIS